MDIDSQDIDSIRERIEEGSIHSLTEFDIERFSLGALIQLACFQPRVQDLKSFSSLLGLWQDHNQALKCLLKVKTNGNEVTRDRTTMFKERPFEFFRIESRDGIQGIPYSLFEARFKSALEASGFGTDLSYALAGAMLEMVDNVVQHSAPKGQKCFPGLIGYYVVEGGMSFGVGDAGRGVLNSLKDNPDWARLENSCEALLKIITENASSRHMQGGGEGFKQLIRSLADLNGYLHFKSGDGYLVLENTQDARRCFNGTALYSPGLQLSVTCTLDGKTKELFLK